MRVYSILFWLQCTLVSPTCVLIITSSPSLGTHAQDGAKWVHSPDVSHLIPQRWDGPKAPSSPMEKLISMGFADRAFNEQILAKHNNDISMVLNELLDGYQVDVWAETIRELI